MVDRLLGRKNRQAEQAEPPIRITLDGIGALANVNAHGSLPAAVLGDNFGELAAQGLITVAVSQRGEDLLKGKHRDHKVVLFPDPPTPKAE